MVRTMDALGFLTLGALIIAFGLLARKDMANIEDKIVNLETVTTTIGEAIQAEIQQLKDAVAAGAPVSDAQFARLDALAEKLTGNVADLTADDVTDVS